MPSYQPLAYGELGPKIRTAIPENAAPEHRIDVAKGLVPLSTTDLLTALYFLCGDPDKRVRQEAIRSLKELPEALTIVGISGNARPKLLHFLATRDYDNHNIHERVALHRNVADETLALLAAGSRHDRVIDIIGKNEAAVLRCPEVLYGLRKNRKTPKNLLDRLEQFYLVEKKHAFFHDLPEAKRAEFESAVPEPEPPQEEPAEDEPIPEPAALEFPDDRLHPCFRIADIISTDFDIPELFSKDFMEDPEQQLDDKARIPLLKRLIKMTLTDRVLLALKGNGEARRFLVKSRSRIIQDCVMRNPKMTLQEISELVRERSTPQNIIDTICRNRDWTRYYDVAYQLCWHPKTPMRHVMRFIGNLTPKDLLRLSKSKLVPQFTAQQARNLLERREKSR